MQGDDIILVEEAEMSLFVKEHRHRWAADELNYRSFLKLDAKSSDQVACLTMRDANYAPIGFACVYKGDQIILSEAPGHGVVALAQYLVQRDIDIPGFFAPDEVGQIFGEYLSVAGRGQFQLVKSVLHWELIQLMPLLPVEGKIRRASKSDVETLVGMHRAMQEELNTQRPYDPRLLVTTGIKRGELFVLEAPAHQIACTGLSSPFTDSKIYGEIDGIYTKPQYRGKGYASSLIWHLASDILQTKPAVFLSSDASDNASFGVYKKLGFKVKTKMANFRKV